VPGVLNDFYVDGNIATIVYGAGLLHALITAPQGVSGQLLDLFHTIRMRAMGTAPEVPPPAEISGVQKDGRVALRARGRTS
jgi:branched-chain amino acid transport system permease protein